MVLGVLFYDAEQVLVRKLKWFHCCCVHCTCNTGVRRAVYIYIYICIYVGHNINITTAQLAECFGIKESIGLILGQSRLGHLI